MDSLLTVTVAASSRRLTTEASLTAEIAAASAPSQAELQALIDQASAAVESFLGRTLARETVSEAFRLERPIKPLILARAPVASISGITEEGVTLSAGAYEADLASGLVWRLWCDSWACWPPGKVVVSYAAGYILPGQAGRTLPHDIERAALIYAASLYQARGRDPLLRSESVQGVASASYLDPNAAAGGMPATAAALLTPYRRRTI